jgi:hypothetical protein
MLPGHSHPTGIPRRFIVSNLNGVDWVGQVHHAQTCLTVGKVGKPSDQRHLEGGPRRVATAHLHRMRRVQDVYYPQPDSPPAT